MIDSSMVRLFSEPAKGSQVENYFPDYFYLTWWWMIPSWGYPCSGWCSQVSGSKDEAAWFHTWCLSPSRTRHPGNIHISQSEKKSLFNLIWECQICWIPWRPAVSEITKISSRTTRKTTTRHMNAVVVNWSTHPHIRIAIPGTALVDVDIIDLSTLDGVYILEMALSEIHDLIPHLRHVRRLARNHVGQPLWWTEFLGQFFDVLFHQLFTFLRKSGSRLIFAIPTVSRIFDCNTSTYRPRTLVRS